MLIVPQLATPIRNSVCTHLNKLSYLRGLPLAHPVTSDENFHISILIGADFYWQFVQDCVVRGNGPIAVESKLGYLLSDPLPLPVTTDTTSFHVSILFCTTKNTDHNSFWQVESTGTNPVTHNPDTKFCSSTWTHTSAYNQMEPTVSSSHGGKTTIPCFHQIIQSVLDVLDPWHIDWPRLQSSYNCMVQSLRNRKEGNSLRK